MQKKRIVNFPEVIVEQVKKVNGQSFTKKFRLIKQLGHGAFASCFEVEDCTTKRKMAVKIIDKAQIQKAKIKTKILNQISIHKVLHHPNIVEFQHLHQDSLFVFIFLQLCVNKSLNDMIKTRLRLSELETRFFAKELIAGISHIHQFNIIHRDIKSSNIFLGNKLSPKIGDFGLATKLQFQGEKKRTICGTPNYISPQILKECGYSIQTDIWSLGVIIYYMLVGKAPFQCDKLQLIYQNIKKCKFQFPIDSNLSGSCKDLLKNIITPAQKRYSLQQIVEHKWFTGFPYLIPNHLPLTCLTKKGQIELVQKDQKNKVPKLMLLPQKSQKDITVMGISSPRCFRSISPSGIKSPRAASPAPLEEAIEKNQVFVYNFYDMDDKYGMGFQLSNGAYGAYFPDNTVLVVDQKLEQIDQIVRANKQSQKCYSIKDYPEDKQSIKKLKLTKFFLKKMSQIQSLKQDRKRSSKKRNVYLKQYIKSTDAVIFRLSNGLIDSFFHSGAELILDNKRVRYWDQKGKLKECQIGQIDPDSDIFDAYSLVRWVVKHSVQKNESKSH